MKLNHLFFAAAAAVLAFAACEPQEKIDVPDLQVTPSSISFDAGASSQTVTLTATRDWTVSGAPEWLAFDPAGGKASDASQTVTITAMANSGYNRSTDVTFTIGLMKAYVHVDQTGEKGVKDNGKGTLESPFTVEGVKAYIDGLDNPSTASPDKVYIKGKITRIADKGTYGESGTYSNATFYISDDGSTDNEFYCYRISYLGNKKFSSGQTDIKVGDEVIVYGNVILYGTSNPVYETSQGTAYLYSLNGETGPGSVPAGDPKGTGAKDDPYNVAAALNAVKDLGWTSTSVYDKVGPYYVKGKISRIADKGTYGESGTYSNATFYISDDGSTDNEFYCYRISYLANKKYAAGQTDIKVGDEVVIYGELMNYRSDTPETVQGSAYLYSLNGDTGGGDTPPGPSGEAKGTGTKDDPFNSVAAANAVKNLTWTNNDTYETTGEVYVKGKISRIADKGTFGESGTYGNASFYVSDDGTQKDEFYCFRILYLGNAKYTSGTDIKVGDEVVVCGQLMNYKGNTPETVAGKAYLYSLNGQTAGGGGGGGETTEIKKVTVAEFLAAPESASQWYEITGKVSNIRSGNGEKYGNFDLTDASGTVYVYGLTSSKVDKNDQSFASLGIKEGDEITIITLRASYNGDPQAGGTPPAYIKDNGGSSGGGGGETSEIKKVTVAEFLAAPESATQWYELTGKVSNIRSGNGEKYGNFDLTDATGTVYVYGLTSKKVDKNDQSFASLGIKEGDEITIITLRASYNGDPQAGGTPPAYIKDNGGSSGGGGETTDIKKATIAEFLAAAESTTQWYELTGKVSNIRSGNGEKYGNFDLTDATGTVYVYGLTSSKVDKNDQSFASLGVKEGDEITIITLRASYNGDPQAGGTPPAYLKSNGGGGQGQGEGGGGEATGTFSSNVEWASGSDGAYNEKATVNGTADVAVLKLGTSKAVGTSTLTLPAGSTSLTFYAVSWKGKASKLVFSVDGKEVGSVSPAANDGLANNSPYTLTVSDSDKYTITFEAASTVKVETSGSNTRAAIFGVQAK